MDIGELIFIFALAGGFLIPTAVTRQWWLFRVFIIFFTIFGLVEWWATASTGLSVSQHFWVYSELHPVGAWCVLGGMAIGWIALLIHLGKNLLKKK